MWYKVLAWLANKNYKIEAVTVRTVSIMAEVTTMVMTSTGDVTWLHTQMSIMTTTLVSNQIFFLFFLNKYLRF